MPKASSTRREGTPLRAVVAKLAPLYPARAPLTDPLSQIVWESIGYLIDDERRTELFAEFSKRVGLKAAQIANAPTTILTDIASRGGMHPQKRAERLHEIGVLTISECDGDLAGKLRSLPLPKARALLKEFPSIGDPGADKILLFSGIAALPALDSNGLRAMARLGYCREEKSYGQTYKAAVAVIGQEGAADPEWLKQVWLVLREHGKALCKRSAPICEPCPLDGVCAHRMTAKL